MPVLTERIVPCVERTILCSEITYLFGHPFFDDSDMVFGGQQIELYSIKNDAYILGDVKYACICV